MKKKYHGVIPAIITPVDKDEKVNETEFRNLIEHNIEQGMHGLFICGTNGESLALTQRERNRAIEIGLDQVKGRIPVISGAMDSSTSRVIENVKKIEELGGTCAAVSSIFYARHTSQSETIRHFEAILKETTIDLMIYNIPPFTGMNLTSNTVDEIAQLSERVVGYKDSSGSYGEFLKVLSKYKGTSFSVLQGMTPHVVSSLLMGADGYVPVLAPIFPEIYVNAYEEASNKNIDEAIKYDKLIADTSEILKMTKNPTAAAKYAMSLLGLTNERVIQPQDTINDQEKEEIRKKVQAIKQGNVQAE